MLNLNTDKETRKSPTKYVIMSRDLSTVVQSPGLNEPWSSTNKKLAETVAAQIPPPQGPGVVTPLREAIKLVVKHPANQPPRGRN